MALRATPVASRLGGTTFGGFGAHAIAAGSRGRATTDLVGALAASSVLSPTSTSFDAAASAAFPAAIAAAAFPAATTAGATAGEHGMASMASVGRLLPASRKSVVPLSNSLDDVIAADTVTRCQVTYLHLVFGRQSVDKDGVKHVVVKRQPCCTHLCRNMLNPTHFLEWVAPRRYLKTMKAPRDIGFGPDRVRAVPRKKSVTRFPRRGTPM